jgi:hypothetical protein
MARGLTSIRRMIFLIMLFAFASVGLAQEPSSISSHEQAARDLYRLTGGVKIAEAGAEAMMGVIRKNPELAPYEEVFRTWYRKVFASGDLESEVAKIYVGAFSEEELRGLVAFYKSPLGQKALSVLPEVTKQSAEIGIRLGQEHSAELQEMITKAKEEREKQGKPDQ